MLKSYKYCGAMHLAEAMNGENATNIVVLCTLPKQ
jgi:hypothetical protein